MIYCTFGVPSRFSEYCEALFLELVTAHSGRPEQFVVESLQQIGRELLSRNCLNAIIVARQPEQAFCREILASNRPTMVTLDRPEAAIGALQMDHGVPYADAVRSVANSMASIAPVVQAKHGLVLTASQDQPGRAIAKAIMEQFGLTLSDDIVEQIVARVPSRPEAAVIEDDPQFESALPGVERVAPTASTAESAIQPLWRHLQGEPMQEIVWTPPLFRLAQTPSQAPLSPIDLTGSGRGLLFGPFIRLPEGPWSCSVMFGCSERVKGVKMVAEVFAGVPLNRITFELVEAGVFEVECSFVNSNPDIPIEVRLFTAEAAFEGEIMLTQVRMFPLKAKRLGVAR
jgi:hypothetical protein